MKKLLLCIMLLSAVGCGHTAKTNLIKKIKAEAKPAAQKYLDCSTGDPVAEDLGEELERLLKVQKAEGSSDPAGAQKGIGESVCVALVKVSLPYLVDLGNGKLPVSWAEDGCSLKRAGETATELAQKLCEKIP